MEELSSVFIVDANLLDAIDHNYAIKLLEIINRYNLDELDKVRI